MAVFPDRAALAAYVQASTSASGVSERIQDPAVLSKMAAAMVKAKRLHGIAPTKNLNERV